MRIFQRLDKYSKLYDMKYNFRGVVNCSPTAYHSLSPMDADQQEWPQGKRELLMICSGGSRIFQMGGRCFVANGGAHILFSGKKCMKLKEIGLKWGGAHLLAPCYSKITIFL